MTTYLITGANRGLGWAMVQQLAQAGEIVFAGCRSPQHSAELQTLAATNDKIHIVQLDVTDEKSVVAAVEAVSAETDNVLGIAIASIVVSACANTKLRIGTTPVNRPTTSTVYK